MRYETSERITSNRPKSDLLEVLREQFSKISDGIRQDGGTLTAAAIATTFGAINRWDRTTISIRTCDGGYLIVADVNYRPSGFFWIFFVLGLFGYFVVWIIPVAFYLYHQSVVKNAVATCLLRVKNEFNEQSHYRQPDHIPPLPPAVTRKFYLHLANQVKGPYSEEQLRALLDTGAVQPDTLTCVAGTNDWHHLAAMLQSAPPPPVRSPNPSAMPPMRSTMIEAVDEQPEGDRRQGASTASVWALTRGEALLGVVIGLGPVLVAVLLMLDPNDPFSDKPFGIGIAILVLSLITAFVTIPFIQGVRSKIASPASMAASVADIVNHAVRVPGAMFGAVMIWFRCFDGALADVIGEENAIVLQFTRVICYVVFPIIAIAVITWAGFFNFGHPRN